MKEKSSLDNVKSKKEQKRERGASLVEYALLVALIAVVCIAAITTLGGSISAKFSGLASSLEGAT